MQLTYETYPYTPILGWSISRYETFDKCRRLYFYTYYSKFATSVPLYKINALKNLTSVPLEIGNVVHDVIEAFLKRLQKSDSDIDERRFLGYARQKMEEYFSTKTFIETYYGGHPAIDREEAFGRIARCLENFIGSSCYTWIFMKALTNRDNWMIEPQGYGETRLNGLKAYCKMDFLFPVDGTMHIMDWKTGARNIYKHSSQLKGYAAAAQANFKVPTSRIFPKIIYLYPEFGEFELPIRDDELREFFLTIREQTQAMHGYCADIANNLPRPIEEFPMTPSPALCQQCNFQELCFTRKAPSAAAGFD